jgi:hypothetical protein
MIQRPSGLACQPDGPLGIAVEGDSPEKTVPDLNGSMEETKLQFERVVAGSDSESTSIITLLRPEYTVGIGKP